MITFSTDAILQLVKDDMLPAGFKIDKNNLLSLLQHSAHATEKVLAASSSFKHGDLLEIINDYDTLSSLRYQAIRLLYFHFNPKREWKASKTPVLEMHYMFSRTEHILGLTDTLDFVVQGKKYALKTAGEFIAVSLKHITEYLRMFGEKYPSEINDQITAAYEHSLSLIVPCHNRYQSDAAKSFLERYKSNQLTLVSTGWEKHGVSLTFFGDYLVYTNRGSEGNPFYGSRIFRIKNKAMITTKLLDKFIPDNIPNGKAFHRILSTIVDLNKPVALFRCKSQRHPTCTFANTKSNIEPLIVLAQAGPFATQKELMDIYQVEYKRRKYKMFSSFIRDREIDEIIKSMFYANNIHLVYFYAALAKKIIREHHGKQLNGEDRGFIKDREEIKRACDFYARIPQKIKTVMNNDHNFVSLMEEIHLKSQNLVNNTPYSLWPQTHYIRTGGRAYKVNVEKGCIVAINNNETPKMHFSYKQAKTLIRTFG